MSEALVSSAVRRLVPRARAAVTGSSAVAAVSGWLFMATGATVLASTSLPHGDGSPQLGAVRLVNALAVVAGGAMLLGRRSAPSWVPHVAVSGGVVLISTAVSVSGGGSLALAYAAVFCLSPGYAFLCLPPRAALGHLALTLVLGVPVLHHQVGVGAAEQVVVWGVVVLLAAVVGWMARALEAAERDALTGLPNRRGLERALHELLSATGSTSAPTVAVLDLDRFSAVNEALGRTGGDRVLTEVAATWTPLLPVGAALARTGADEFWVLLPDAGPGAGAGADLVTRLHASMPSGTTCSAGVATREAGESASMLLARAESALYGARREGRGRTHVHPGGVRDGREIREALRRGEIVAHYQPIVSLGSGTTVAAEALVRWQRPDGELRLPGSFLEEAETSGVIVELGEHVLRSACREAATWTAVDGRAPYVTVNASGRELQDPGYHLTVASALADAGLPPERLVLELVESHYDIESLHLLHNLHMIKALGVRTALDDFGVGYSSLHRLRRAGVDILKIDKSFTDDVVDGSSDAPLVAAIIGMAKALHLVVVAEGVESAAQAAWLSAHGCDNAQGWHYGKAAPSLVRQEHERPTGRSPSATARRHD